MFLAGLGRVSIARFCTTHSSDLTSPDGASRRRANGGGEPVCSARRSPGIDHTDTHARARRTGCTGRPARRAAPAAALSHTRTGTPTHRQTVRTTRVAGGAGSDWRVARGRRSRRRSSEGHLASGKNSPTWRRGGRAGGGGGQGSGWSWTLAPRRPPEASSGEERGAFRNAGLANQPCPHVANTTAGF